MLSIKIKNSNSLLKSKTTKTKNSKSKNRKTTKNKNNNSKKIKRPHIIDKICKIYKKDISGKLNNKLYNSCKINKYCRKYKCQNIDYKILKAKNKHFGNDYNKIIFDKIKLSCPQNILEDDPKIVKKQKNCVNKTIKNIYKDNNLEEIYKKSVECDNIICAKEKKIFNSNLFRQKQLKLKKSQIQNTTGVDHDLIINGDL